MDKEQYSLDFAAFQDEKAAFQEAFAVTARCPSIDLILDTCSQCGSIIDVAWFCIVEGI
jgi:hypothetical protein